MSWPRPIPLVGDPTSAAQRAADPTGWDMGEPVRAGLAAAIAARRDVRRYRSDPVDDATVTRVLAAAHAAPSVGHSQPWRFIVVRSPATRDAAAVLADAERLRQAAQLDPESGRRLLDLQLDGIREAPVGIVVCCDRRAAPAGVLGRATFPDADLWSCACAIQNAWLTARACGLGMGWVTLFRPADLADLLGLPDGVVTLGWLCLGWPDERPPDPGLERAGWSRRQPLDSVVLAERWDGAAPAPVSRLRAPAPQRVVAARDAADRLLTPPGSLGVLDRALARLLAAAPGLADGGLSGTLVLVAADHPVADLGVSAYPGRVTGDVAAAAVAGQALGAAAARAAGLGVWVVDAGVATAVAGARDLRPRHRRGDLASDDALDPRDVTHLLAAGRDLGREAATRGVVALGEVGVGNTTVATALAGALLGGTGPLAVGIGAGADSPTLAAKEAVLAAARRRVAGVDLDPLSALAALGGPEIVVLAGVVLGAAAGGAPVLLDGLVTGVAALAAVRLEPAAGQYLIAGSRSGEPAHAAVLAALGCEPLLDLRLRAGEGVGACLAAGLLAQALAMRAAAGRTG